jgi:hypothetical protein
MWRATMCQFQQRKDGQDCCPDLGRSQPSPLVPRFPLRLDWGQKEKRATHASLISYQLAPCPITVDFGRKVLTTILNNSPQKPPYWKAHQILRSEVHWCNYKNEGPELKQD